MTTADVGRRNQARFWSPQCRVRASPAVKSGGCFWLNFLEQLSRAGLAGPFSFTKTLTVFQSLMDTQDARRTRSLNRKAETTAFLKVGVAKCVGCALLALACVISLKREFQDVYDKAFHDKF